MNKGFGGKTYGKESTRRMMLKSSLRNRVGGVGVDWIDLAPSRKKWRAPVSTVTKLRIVSNAGNSMASQELVDYQQSLCSMEYIN